MSERLYLLSKHFSTCATAQAGIDKVNAIFRPQATNFLRAFRTIREATALGLILSEVGEIAKSQSLAKVIQNWHRFALQHLHQVIHQPCYIYPISFMQSYKYIFSYIYKYIFLYIYKYIFLYIYKYIFLYIYKYIFLYIYKYIFLYIYKYIFLYIYKYIFLYIYIYIHVFIYSFMMSYMYDVGREREGWLTEVKTF